MNRVGALLQRYILHPHRILLIAVCSLCLPVSVWIAERLGIGHPWLWVVIGIMQIGALASYWIPLTASVIMLLLNSALGWMSPEYQYVTMYYMALALLLIGYETSNRIATMVVTALILYVVVQYLIVPRMFSLVYLLIVVLISTTAVGIGCYARWNHERNIEHQQMLQSQHELQQLRTTQMLANVIHDSLSQELAAISMIAQRELLHEQSNRDPWEKVQSYSKSALVDMRTLIRQLHDYDASSVDMNFTEFVTHVRNTIQQEDNHLHHKGFHGASELQVQSQQVHSDVTQVSAIISMLMHEIYTNIYKHANVSRPYNVSVVISDTAFIVESCNIAQTDEVFSSLGGNGLRLLDTILHTIGGQLTLHTDHGVWQLRGDIPIPTDE